MICSYFSEPTWFVFVPDLPSLLYYSHIPTIIITLLVGLFVYFASKRTLSGQLLFAICVSFSVWVFFSLISWTNIHSDFILFIWSFFGILTGLIAIFSIYFVSVFLHQKDVLGRTKFIFLLLLAPLLFLAPTNWNLSGFNTTACGAFDFENEAYTAYTAILGAIAIIWVFFMLAKAYWHAIAEKKREILLLGLGIELFLLLFVFVTYIGSLLTTLGITPDSQLEMHGLFGMDIFVIFLAYLIVKFKAFNAKLLGAQALVAGLIMLIGSLFFFFYDASLAALIILSTTLVLACIGGYFLVKSVKKEVKQREQLEELTEKLEVANEHLKVLDKMKSEFVSIASHQLRSPITAIRGYVSMLLEGSYGKFPEKAQEVLERIGESSKFMATSIEDYLNVSRIEAGNMKYELSDFNLKEQAEKVTDELRASALKKGLVLVFRSDVTGSAMVNADIGKTRQVISNFIDNAIKYTPQGTVTVVAHDDPTKKKMWVTISDTGIGMSRDTLAEVFDKFVRAKNANQINVTGTGLGLYVAKKMAAGMGGKVWAESEGEGKGSQFHIEFAELPGAPKVV